MSYADELKAARRRRALRAAEEATRRAAAAEERAGAPKKHPWRTMAVTRAKADEADDYEAPRTAK